MMSIRRRRLFLIIIFGFSLISLILYSTQFKAASGTKNISPMISIIAINGNDELNSTAHSQGWDGDGTSSSPIIIDSKLYTDSLKISNTNLFFEIYLINFQNFDDALVFDNVTNAKIIQCQFFSNIRSIVIQNSKNIVIDFNTIYNNQIGILLEHSENNTINNNNLIYDNTLYGIIIYQSDPQEFVPPYNRNNIISSNNIHDNRIGILIESSNNTQIEENNIQSNDLIGINIISSLYNNITQNTIDSNPNDGLKIESNNNTIYQNSISSNGHGLVLSNCSFNQLEFNLFSANINTSLTLLHAENNSIINNTIQNCQNIGILCDHAGFNQIWNNTITNTNKSGISLINSTQLSVVYNYFLDNKGEAISISIFSERNQFLFNNVIQNNIGNGPQAMDNGSENIFDNNYWKDWSDEYENDTNNDEILDEPYQIGGTANNSDPNPHVSLIPEFPVNPYYNPEEDPKGYEYVPLINPGTVKGIVLFSGLILSLGLVGAAVVNTSTVKSVMSESIISESIKHVITKQGLPVKLLMNNSIIQNTTLVNFINTIQMRALPEILKKIVWVVIVIPISWFMTHVLHTQFAHNLSETDVLNNRIRFQTLKILDKVKFENFNALQDQIKCGVSILRWHLQVLEDYKLIKSLTLGKFKVYFRNNGSIDRRKIEIYCSLRSEIAMNIVMEFLKLREGTWKIGDLSKTLNLSYKVTQYYCKKLMNLGVLTYLPKSKEYTLVNSERIYLLWLIGRNQYCF